MAEGVNDSNNLRASGRCCVPPENSKLKCYTVWSGVSGSGDDNTASVTYSDGGNQAFAEFLKGIPSGIQEFLDFWAHSEIRKSFGNWQEFSRNWQIIDNFSNNHT